MKAITKIIDKAEYFQIAQVVKLAGGFIRLDKSDKKHIYNQIPNKVKSEVFDKTELRKINLNSFLTLLEIKKLQTLDRSRLCINSN